MKARRRYVIVGVIVAVCLLGLIFAGYWFDWTGLDGYNKVTIAHILSGPSRGTVTRTEEYQPGKGLWDWLQLLIIPAVLAIGGYLFTYTTTRNERKAADLHNQIEREIAWDNQCQAILQAYINKMSELLLHERLRDSAEKDEIRKIARVQTLTVLSQLDFRRKKSVMQFLFESDLIWANNSAFEKKNIISLSGADLNLADLRGIELFVSNLSNVNLNYANLGGADLSTADLRRSNLYHAILTRAKLHDAILNRAIMENAYLRDANLRGADIRDANLRGANLSDADLSTADLSGADLTGAIITKEQWETAKSLKGATMPDGSIHS